MANERVSFEEAVGEPLLLKDFFDALSMPQQCTLKLLYGLPLDPGKVSDRTGFSEMDYWSILQGFCEYDELGYVTKVKPGVPVYTPKEYDQLWALYGRRSGKTDKIMALALAYEAALGGHEAYISRGQDCVVYLVAHRMDLAKATMPSIRSVLDSSKLLSKEIHSQAAEALRLKNNVNVVPSPPSLKAQRGTAVPAVGLDEVAFWFSDADAANPDFEVERAVAYSQLQFPHSKRLGVTTVWSKEGLAYKYHKAGTEGCKLPASDDRSEYEGILTCFAPTAALDNPRISRKKLEKLQAKDHDAFDRESLCIFPDSISGFFSPALLEAAVAAGVTERVPILDGDMRPFYVAAMDPAFRYDSFAFVIAHREAQKGVVVDLTRRWTPIRGMKLNPKEVLSEIRLLLTSYGINQVVSDQYQLEALQQLALEMNITIEGMDFTARSKAKIYGNLNQLFNQRKLVLLDGKLSESNATMLSELRTLEKRIASGGSIQIGAPDGKHDDMCSALAQVAAKCVWLMPTIVEEVKEETLFDRGMSTIQKYQAQQGENPNWTNWD